MVISLWAYGLRAVVVRAEPAAADRASQRREGDGRQKRDEVRDTLTDAQWLPGPGDLGAFTASLDRGSEEATNHVSGRNTSDMSWAPPTLLLRAPSHGEENPHVHDPSSYPQLVVHIDRLHCSTCIHTVWIGPAPLSIFCVDSSTPHPSYLPVQLM